eukprot:11353484-Karenia_brevis.AAC.1
MLSYIYGHPTYASSHQFVNLYFSNHLRFFLGELYGALGLAASSMGGHVAEPAQLNEDEEEDAFKDAKASTLCPKRTRAPTFTMFDYQWRGRALEDWPLFFFTAGTDRVRIHTKSCEPWLEHREAGVLLQEGKAGHHPCMFDERCLDTDGDPITHADYVGAEAVPGCA